MIIDVRNIDLKGKTVLVRCDFNVPLKTGKIADSSRIDASLETIRFIASHGARVVLCSHLGRPKRPSPELSLEPVAHYLSVALSKTVSLAPDSIGDVTLRLIDSLSTGDILLLENLRFHPEEEANDPEFAHELARGKQVYVNDAFGTAHRAHASTVGVARFLAQRAAGLLMMRELNALQPLTRDPAHPYVAILGGAKVGDKIGLIRNLLRKVDTFLIGGAMAYTFLKAQGLSVGKSKVEEDKVALAREMVSRAANQHIKLLVPSDHIVVPHLAADTPGHVVVSIPSDELAVDIGPATAERFVAELANAKTIVWNGPLGVYEYSVFAQGTLKVGKAPHLSALIASSPAATH
jgi:phosphoglycerate kinase